MKCLLFSLIIIIKFSTTGYFALYVSQVMVYPNFCEIRGLGVRLHDSYDRLISTMGEPHKREILERDDFFDLEALHYDDVIFFVHRDNNRIIYIDLISEQFTLGGPMWRRIGVGSTREEVEYDFERRHENSIRWADGSFGYRKYYKPRSLPNAELGFISTQLWTYVEFEFDENDIVIRIRIGVAI